MPERAGWLGQTASSRAAAASAPTHLGADVGERLAAGEVAGEGEGERHRRVEVGAGEVAGRVDHRHDHQAEDERDADRAERAGVDRVGDDRAAAGEDEGEGADALGGGAAA